MTSWANTVWLGPQGPPTRLPGESYEAYERRRAEWLRSLGGGGGVATQGQARIVTPSTVRPPVPAHDVGVPPPSWAGSGGGATSANCAIGLREGQVSANWPAPGQ